MAHPTPLITGSTTPPVTPTPSLLGDVLDTACVVIVDDEQANVTLLERMLRSVGVPNIHGVTDPHQAVQRCREVAADLILLDLHMPGRDGFAILADLEATLPPDTFLPVLVLTADSDSAVRDRALHAGATDFLTKPLDRIEVILRVRNLLQTRALYVDVQTRNATLAAELDRRQALERRAEKEHATRQARIDNMLARRDFTMVFQPIADLNTGDIVGAEALARFTAQPHRPPNEWFAEADAVGSSQQLEVAAVAMAVEQLHQMPPQAFLAVNVSPETAISPELTGLLERIPPDRLVLELTEHNRVNDYAGLLDGLAALRSRGFRVAVDDAGAGYAGLHHVLRLNPELLKLDIHLIQAIDQDPAKRALSTALVAFAHETGATIIAEGIESAAELHTLRTLGIRWGQGFHLARPQALPLQPVRA